MTRNAFGGLVTNKLLGPKYHQNSRLGWKSGVIWPFLTVFRIYLGTRGWVVPKSATFCRVDFESKMAIFDQKWQFLA